MNPTTDNPPPPIEDSSLVLQRLIDDVRAARSAGQQVDEAALLQAHPQLQTELQHELDKLRRIEAARAAAALNPDSQTAPPSPELSAANASNRATVQAVGYSIERELARGGQSRVYLATQLSTGRNVALKVLYEGPQTPDRMLARFQREVQVLAALNHPNIVTIIDTGQTADGHRFIAMKYIAGPSLGDYMKYRLQKEPADPSKLLRLFLKICDAVNAAHRLGIAHRDLKPSNIRLDERGEPQVLDFGLAHAALDSLIRGTEQPISITGEFLGTLPWASPEQAEGDPQKIDIRTDIYSLGVILYQMLTGGKFPYEVVGNMRDVLNNILTAEPLPPSKVIAAANRTRSTPQPPQLARPNLPVINEAIEKIVLKALAKRREDRYQNAGEMQRDIANYLLGRPTGPRPAEPATVATSSNRLWKALTALSLLAALICGILYAIQSSRHESPPVQNRPIDLLKLIDPAKDTLHGIFTLQSGILIHNPAGPNNTGNSSLLEFPYAPPQEYDYRMVFLAPMNQSWHNDLICCAGGHQFSFTIHADGNCGFGLIDGKPYDQTPAAKTTHSLADGQPHAILLSIHKDGIEAYLDGQCITHWGTDFSDMTLPGNLAMNRTDTIGIMLTGDHQEIRSADLIETTGEGKLLR